MADPAPPAGPHACGKGQVRNRILDEAIALRSEGRIDIGHDLIAGRTAISRRAADGRSAGE